MKLDQIDLFGGAAAPAGDHEQFRLDRFQVFNWGTFSDLVDIAITEKGFLFVGPSGSGKSTLLDAHSTLMTPPKWLGFNLAAREGETNNQDRNLMTYVRGAWAQQTGKSGEAVQQYLRENTTWSALAETYTSTTGRSVTIAQVFWVRGKSVDRKEIKRAYLVIDRAFDLRELQQFADKDFDLKVLREQPGITVHAEFSGYRDRFSRLVGIEQESALRLLHKTQSAKNLGDLNDFLRDFMLDPPETFDLAERLVGHFQSLRDAHASVVDSRRQIEVLAPARVAFEQLEAERHTLRHLSETRANLDAFKEQRKHALLADMIARALADIDDKSAHAADLRQTEEETRGRLNILLGKRNGAASAQIAQCEAAATAARQTLRNVETNQLLLTDVTTALETAMPADAGSFASLQETVRAYLADTQRRDALNLARRDDLKLQHRDLTAELRGVQAEIAALSRSRSNIPVALQDVRSRICTALGLDEAALPFAGELVDVRDDEQAWKGAAERVMRNFAENLLVADAYYPAVSEYINRNHMGTVVKYFRVQPAADFAASVPGRLSVSGKPTLFSKLAFGEHPLAGWVATKAAGQFDHECVDSPEAMRHVRRAVTREGLVKSDDVSFRKDDRFNINDRSKWILGGDTRAKLANCMDRADTLEARVRQLDADILALAPTGSGQQNVRRCEKLMEMSWDVFDLATALRQHDAAAEQLAIAREAMPDIDSLDNQIHDAEREHKRVQQAASSLEAQCETLRAAVAGHEERQSGLNQELLAVDLAEETLAMLTERYAAHAARLDWDNLELVTSQVKDVLAKEERAVQSRMASALNAMQNQFRDYKRDWPAKAANLDTTEACAAEFFDILSSLETDGLPQFEERFLQLLKEQSLQEMMRLARQLEEERKAIKTRLIDVNESLESAAFNPGTHLVIETKDKQLPDVMAFRQSMNALFSHAMEDDSPAEAEKRFHLLNDIVLKLESQEVVAKQWRELCLDVRRHVDFIIRELDADGNEMEVYRSGAGKSGGQRQKLTATCLAAALRYQLGGKDTGLPKYATVFMDEAFDKADAEFTDLAMNIFKTFGFQLVVATPLKSVMTLEPYIGGACFVHIEDRKRSRIVPVTYLEDARKLDFGGAGVNVDAQPAD